MKKYYLVIAAFLMGAMTAYADDLVTVRPVGTDSVYWAQFVNQPYYASAIIGLPSPFNFSTANGISGTGSYANPQDSWGYGGGVGAAYLDGLMGFANLGAYQYTNWTDNSGPLTLNFGQGYTQIGAQIATEYGGAFTAQICDVNGCFSEDGYSTNIADSIVMGIPSIYIGVESSTPINWVTFSVTSAPRYPNDFAINDVTLDSSGEAPTPEPSSLLLFGTGLVGFAGVLRRKFVR